MTWEAWGEEEYDAAMPQEEEDGKERGGMAAMEGRPWGWTMARGGHAGIGREVRGG